MAEICSLILIVNDAVLDQANMTPSSPRNLDSKFNKNGFVVFETVVEEHCPPNCGDYILISNEPCVFGLVELYYPDALM